MKSPACVRDQLEPDDAAVHEFNCNWIAGVDDYPSARHWQDYGARLAPVFYEYFAHLP